MDAVMEHTLNFIKNHFKNDTSGHDYYHSFRVYQLATKIAACEKANLFLVQMAALLHDVDDYKLSQHSETLMTTRSFLNTLNIADVQRDDICKIISEISYKGADTLIPSTMEGKIVQDADRIDALGAIGIARAFTYGGSIHRNIYIPDCLPQENMCAEDYYNHSGSTINHFYEKLLKLYSLMNTETGKLLAKHRYDFIKDFLTEFYKEWNCEI